MEKISLTVHEKQTLNASNIILVALSWLLFGGLVSYFFADTIVAPVLVIGFAVLFIALGVVYRIWSLIYGIIAVPVLVAIFGLGSVGVEWRMLAIIITLISSIFILTFVVKTMYEFLKLYIKKLKNHRILRKLFEFAVLDLLIGFGALAIFFFLGEIFIAAIIGVSFFTATVTLVSLNCYALKKAA